MHSPLLLEYNQTTPCLRALIEVVGGSSSHLTNLRNVWVQYYVSYDHFCCNHAIFHEIPHDLCDIDFIKNCIGSGNRKPHIF